MNYISKEFFSHEILIPVFPWPTSLYLEKLETPTSSLGQTYCTVLNLHHKLYPTQVQTKNIVISLPSANMAIPQIIR